MQGVLLLGTALAAYLGFALLALTQARPWQKVVQTPPPTGLRPSFGALLWATAISLAALAVAFTLTWRPNWLRPLARLLCVGRPGVKRMPMAAGDESGGLPDRRL